MLATGTRVRLPAQAERERQLNGADVVGGGGAEDVGAWAPGPADGAVARREAPGRQCPDERAARRLDPDHHPSRARPLERRGDAPPRRASRGEAEAGAAEAP